MKITVEDGDNVSSSKLGESPIVICFNALRGLGITDEEILKSMYAFSSQYIKVQEDKPKDKK